MVEEVNTKTMKKLEKKLNSKRVVNENVISKEVKPWQKVLEIVLNIFFGVLVILSGVFCFNVINNRAHKTPVSFLGYNALRVVSGSMLPDYKIGDCILVHSVNPHSLSVGDNIAFYVYGDSTNLYNSKKLTPVEDSDRKVAYSFSFNQTLGVQSEPIRTAAMSGATLVFHKINAIEQDEEGSWWFTTKGTNNATIDNWRINEKYVVGVYVPNSVSSLLARLLNNSSKSLWFLLIMVIPITVLAVMIVRGSIKDVQRAKLELDCVEEKRKITDPLCVKNKIGLNLSKKDKIKVLATAPQESKMEYAQLLWPKDKIPNWIRKYYLKQGAFLRPIERLRDINRQCEKMYKEGVSLKGIGAYYEKERAKIDGILKLRYQRISKMK